MHNYNTRSKRHIRVTEAIEVGVGDSRKSYVQWEIADMEMITRRINLRDVEDIANIRKFSLKLRSLIVDHKCIDVGVIDP